MLCWNAKECSRIQKMCFVFVVCVFSTKPKASAIKSTTFETELSTRFVCCMNAVVQKSVHWPPPAKFKEVIVWLLCMSVSSITHKVRNFYPAHIQ